MVSAILESTRFSKSSGIKYTQNLKNIFKEYFVLPHEHSEAPSIQVKVLIKTLFEP